MCFCVITVFLHFVPVYDMLIYGILTVLVVTYAVYEHIHTHDKFEIFYRLCRRIAYYTCTLYLRHV